MKLSVVAAGCFALLNSGCSPAVVPNVGQPLHPIEVLPPIPTVVYVAPKPPPLVGTAYSPSRVFGDTRRLKAQAKALVDTTVVKPAVLDHLAELTAAATNAADHLRDGHTKAGYQPQDIISARTAADKLSEYLNAIEP